MALAVARKREDDQEVDNDRDAIEDVTFEVQSTTEVRAPDVPLGLVGAGDGIPAPAGSNAPTTRR